VSQEHIAAQCPEGSTQTLISPHNTTLRKNKKDRRTGRERGKGRKEEREKEGKGERRKGRNEEREK